MRIVLLNQFFWPDVAATAQLLTDVARELSTQHEVAVICSGGRYDARQDLGEEPRVRIIRIPGTPFARGSVQRAASYATFFTGALFHLMRLRRPDVVVTLTTPPLLSVAGSVLKLLRGSRHIIWEMDMFPEVLASVGALHSRGLAYLLLEKISNASRRSACSIIALGPCMQSMLLKAGVSPQRVHIAENWADGSAISPMLEPQPSDAFHVFYSGNLGVSHDTGTVLQAIRHLDSDGRFTFTFAGGGQGKQELSRICAEQQLTSARFLPYADRAAMSQHLATATVGLVTERPESLGTVVPSKIYGLMAAGKPLLFIGPASATPAQVIRRFQCGWQVDPGDWQGLVRLLHHLQMHREQVRMCGRQARQAFEQHYDLPHGVSRIVRIVTGAERATAFTTPLVLEPQARE
ncbi:MAG: glycosyltransferase family 4 protein [Bryobacterales bacterium]|nr:glycosyltransferase family 4 protein [Bryobacterales bacterium]